VATVSVINRSLSPEEVKARYEAQKSTPVEREQPLSNWLSSPCMKVCGVSVTRRDVVAFVANKLGGVHLDNRRNPKKDAGYVALDEARERVGILGTDSVYAELAAIGQQFISSPEIQSLS
jgi:hypothetical protein